MIRQATGILRVGTSGIVVPGNRQSFPAEYQSSSRLNYYSSLFNTLEVNSTFKKIPKNSTFEKWSGEVNEQFQFTIKLWKEITHVKQLKINLENIDTFITAANNIGDKKGCLLVQFPASITAEYVIQLEQILERLQKIDSKSEWRKAVELRSVSWYSAETFKLLNQYQASMVLHDMPKSKNLEIDNIRDFAYFRFHGPIGDYRGCYTHEFLEIQAEKMRTLLNDRIDVYVYFNNTMGNAFENAMTLKTVVEKTGS